VSAIASGLIHRVELPMTKLYRLVTVTLSASEVRYGVLF
jgi:hypothetical protein